ncbi:IclR family transcriptional regulator [Natrarchaeobius sp. A-rgal3]|uniref:IclR family transcriptional regulator n=1 Tax=Natrarchaeobius versutus TaxID=1679078 RepID=UPI00350F2642
MTDDPVPIGSLETSGRIIDVLVEDGASGVTHVAGETGISKGTVHKHLSSLRTLGYVVKDGTSYRLSLRYLGIGNRVRMRNELYQIAKPIIDELAETVRATTNLMIAENGFGVYVYRNGEASEWSGHLPAVGQRVHLHATAGGKAILSQYAEERIDDIVTTHGLAQLTGKTITDEREFKRELRSVRDRGLAFERGEHLPSIQCVGSPIGNSDGPIGSISVSGSIDRMSGKKLEEDFAGLVVSKANEIEVALLKNDFDP